MKHLRTWAGDLRSHFTHGAFVWTFLVSTALLGVSLLVNFYAGLYATESASNAVTDVVLSNIRVYNVSFFFVQGPLLLWAFVAILALHKPQRIPFLFKSLALFVIIRSVFISLTHIGPFPTQAVINPESWIRDFSFSGDLFFSAHTGTPFLLALIFWEHTMLRYIFLAASVFFGIVVLMGHLHYSIDVLSAYFITYTIFHLAVYFFKKDRTLFRSGLGTYPLSNASRKLPNFERKS